MVSNNAPKSIDRYKPFGSKPIRYHSCRRGKNYETKPIEKVARRDLA
jgi:hypothetical protein